MANSSALKRPQPGDSEEEIIRMQDDFLRTQQKPSAKLINLSSQFKNESHPEIQGPSNTSRRESKFTQLKKLRTQQERVSTSSSSGNVLNPKIDEKVDDTRSKKTCDMVQNIPVAPSSIILGNILEKKYDTSNYEFMSTNKILTDTLEGGFPKAFVSDSLKSEGSGSLFWQNITKEKKNFKTKDTSEDTDLNISSEDNDVAMDSSVLIQGKWADEIHKENVAKLNQMTPEEILQEKRKLEAALSPDLIQFLKNRKNMKNKEKVRDKSNPKSLTVTNNDVKVEASHVPMECDNGCKESEKEAIEVDPTNNVESTITQCEDNSKPDVEGVGSSDTSDFSIKFEENVVNLPEQPTEILNEAKKKGWVHMDSVELEKLKWMDYIPVDRKQDPNEPYNARFDFNGLLLPFEDDNLTVDKGLHHHGEEPERPGYSLQELLQLCRSSTPQQRYTALTTLANILDKSRKGWYDKALEPSVLTALSQKNILILLRFSLDDTSVAVVTATLQALRAFLYSEADEVCLDRLYGWDNYKEPVLTPPLNDVDDTSNLKDHELAQLDAIGFILRSDIVLRIRYILSEVKPEPVGVTCALEILIRLARFSHTTALNIVCTPNLLSIIVENFMPLCTDRLVTQDSVINAYGTPMVMAVRLCCILITYAGKPAADRLENLKIIQVILSYISSHTGKAGINLSIESLRLWKSLLQHQVAIDSVSATRLTLISQLQLLLSNHDLESASELSCEYAAALIDVAAFDTSLQESISTLLLKWSTQLTSLQSPTWGTTKLVAQTLLAARDKLQFKTAWIENTNIFIKLRSTSNLLSDCIPATEREPSCLPSLGVLTQGGQIQPMVSQYSCIPFLATALNFFYQESLFKEIQMIIEQFDFERYLYSLESHQWNLTRSWYTRMEFYLLIPVVKALHSVGDELRYLRPTLWKIAIKLISSLPADNPSNVKKVLGVALSNKRYHLEIIANNLAELKLNADVRHLKFPLENDVKTIYERYIEPNGSWKQAAMPFDWLYLPLVHIYSNCKNNVPFSEQDKATIMLVLGLELLLPDLTFSLSPTLRFSRLILVYLCDTAYLNEDVSYALSKAISVLLVRYHRELDFTGELPGLNSFVDLFTAMCEHFSSTSYGDENFAMVLLVPIAQKHDVHYRKLLWSEHAGALRYLRLPVERLVVPLKKYLYPAEEDVSLIESYLTALVRGTVRREWCPVPYAIAIHHSALYLKRETKLASRMRTQIERIQDKELAMTLLSYKPPHSCK